MGISMIQDSKHKRSSKRSAQSTNYFAASSRPQLTEHKGETVEEFLSRGGKIRRFEHYELKLKSKDKIVKLKRKMNERLYP